ncbi:hypothetical protein [Streptomyces minutiscleroticus]|nr:hypothetical protein [Streptomyces minutiscleroticus]
MDLHRRRSVLCAGRTTGSGWAGRSASTTIRPGSSGQIAKAGPQPKVVLEAMLGWYRAADVLAETGAEVHLTCPLRVKRFAHRRVKNDERDAADLADLLRLPEAWPAPPQTREPRQMARRAAQAGASAHQLP